METYTLKWTPAQNQVPTLRDVIQVTQAGEVSLAKDLDPTAAETDQNFPTDSQVEYFTRLRTPDGSLVKESDHFTFTATDQTPPPAQLLPDTALGAAWKNHTPDVPPQAPGGRVRLPGDP